MTIHDPEADDFDEDAHSTPGNGSNSTLGHRAAVGDAAADLATRLFRLYEDAGKLPVALEARQRREAIVRAAQKCQVWRQFCGLRDGFLTPASVEKAQ